MGASGMRYRRPSRVAVELHDWAKERGASHFLTLTLGFSPSGLFDPEVSFKPQLKKLFRHIARGMNDVPRRRVARMSLSDAPRFAGVYEPRTKEGVPYPHIHGFIAVPAGREADLRGILRKRWGRDSDPHATALDGYFDMPFFDRAPHSVTPRAYDPTFDLQLIKGVFQAEYTVKGGLDGGLWTENYILDIESPETATT